MMRTQVYLRDLFWLLLVSATLCGWWMQQGRIAEARRERDAAKQEARNLERVNASYQKIIGAYRADGRLSDVSRPDGSVYVTDKQIVGGMSEVRSKSP